MPTPSSRSVPTAAAERLEDERARLRTRLEQMDADMSGLFAASRDSNADDEHDPEGQTIAYERAQLAALIEQARAHLAELDAAAVRLREGTYGICEVCHEPIAPGRLEARPTATTCVAHAAR
ncbi:TraR/DksA C4-type zinc finger protein [Luteipulveratus sp. YIM 133132]|uniref:TraR/DksA family transcriptional regulator n=1 Tax=Luteipulveratus flavus TaxID=3031728 RepID=UPI0023AFC127|nr:TraR/DksA C4-type zinc finger protein [Luteipulveratus sp. YIM 133132]MDE9364439.1 TraR/DksA C4-type zinc finger protein [Luteipulveratus sp. YIM 133132]